jgi:heavy metal sensor kinase
LRETYQFTETGECVLTGYDMAEDLEAIKRFSWWLAAAGGGVLALGLGGGWLLISGAISPIWQISTTARRISEGNLAERIDIADTDSELGRLASVLNSTFARLEASFAQQKQFSADASHELRTPMSVIISEIQTTLAQPRSGAEYREAFAICLQAAQQMRKLTQSLLQLARYDSGQEELRRIRLDLAIQARLGAELMAPLAKERRIRLVYSLTPTIIRADADRLSQVIINLIGNAIHYNREHGEVRITSRPENDAGVLTVEDTGLGISPEDLPHLCKRFYRANKARVHADGHHGLGLAICKAIVEAHGGTVHVSSRPGIGSTFTVHLPN